MLIENASFLRTMLHLSSRYYRQKEKGAGEHSGTLSRNCALPLLLEISDTKRKFQQDHKWHGPKPKISPSKSHKGKKMERRKLRIWQTHWIFHLLWSTDYSCFPLKISISISTPRNVHKVSLCVGQLITPNQLDQTLERLLFMDCCDSGLGI